MDDKPQVTIDFGIVSITCSEDNTALIDRAFQFAQQEHDRRQERYEDRKRREENRNASLAHLVGELAPYLEPFFARFDRGNARRPDIDPTEPTGDGD